jgi:hypothetical protein
MAGPTARGAIAEAGEVKRGRSLFAPNSRALSCGIEFPICGCFTHLHLVGEAITHLWGSRHQKGSSTVSECETGEVDF